MDGKRPLPTCPEVVPNFIADEAQMNFLPVWVRFPILPVEFYTTSWLVQAGNRIGRTLKVDDRTLQASRGKFARVCVEIVLTKPLKAGYMLRGKLRRVQYEGLHSICFHCGRYGHKVLECPLLNTKKSNTEQQEEDRLQTASAKNNSIASLNAIEREAIMSQDAQKAFGPWTIARRRRR